MIPEKRLLTQGDIEIWTRSSVRKSLLGFIVELAESIKGLENDNLHEPIEQPVEHCSRLLDEISAMIEKYPVEEDAATSRFGKIEFRYFYSELKSKSQELILQRFETLSTAQAEELAVYLTESWGDCNRIDYGSGHELNFMCFLYGLREYGVLEKSYDRNIVLKVFAQYLDIMRLLETKYWLEPAGSHGVWGLDDYHFIPFLFGAFQLSTHKHLKPKSIHNEEVVEMFAKKYLYFGCIDFINKVKTTASLRWHSPMLDDISGVKSWAKVAEGMVKMYEVEVLGKLPIMQHFFFGSFLQCPEGVSPSGTEVGAHDQGCKHSPLQNTWGDCCGIRVPSAVAATGSQKSGAKRLPFD
ncbi:LANO_0H15742g1_1 [Lachancea nothofagi CBS 11611]|uniref:Serine/threonine-protein phosphatase 2A activator n=1 Tax=Lachancea nothofagi CBS 11611 TaxID=1266666 RepID=A0A1G4KMS5_9SACH|nr:LANO_0H15742g1_1 [Lachancea nothofagi CBS 11611]